MNVTVTSPGEFGEARSTSTTGAERAHLRGWNDFSIPLCHNFHKLTLSEQTYNKSYIIRASLYDYFFYVYFSRPWTKETEQWCT